MLPARPVTGQSGKKRKKEEKKKQRPMKNRIACVVCDSAFVRSHPAQTRCENCKTGSPQKNEEKNNHVADGSNNQESQVDIGNPANTSAAPIADNLSPMDLGNLPQPQQDKDATISLLYRTIQDRNDQIQELKATIKTQNSKIQELEKEIAEKKTAGGSVVDESTNIQELENKVAELTMILGNRTYESLKSTPRANATKPSFAAVTKGTSKRAYPVAPNEVPELTKTYAAVLTPLAPTTSKVTVSQLNAFKKVITDVIPQTERNFQITQLRGNNRGEIIAVFPSKEDQHKAVQKLSSKSSELLFSIEKARTRLPRLQIRNIPAESATEKIVSEIKETNKEIADLIKSFPGESIRFITALKTKHEANKNVVIEVTPKLLKFIKKTESIKLGMVLYKVFDHIHVIQCTKCQKFGHKAGGTNPCRADKQVCGLCCGEHETGKCKGFSPDGPDKEKAALIQKKCANCKADNHGAIERKLCESYMTHVSDLKAKIDLSDD